MNDDTRDIHAETASTVLGKAPDDLTPEEREIGRTVNFGMLYGNPERIRGILADPTGKKKPKR